MFLVVVKFAHHLMKAGFSRAVCSDLNIYENLNRISGLSFPMSALSIVLYVTSHGKL